MAKQDKQLEVTKCLQFNCLCWIGWKASRYTTWKIRCICFCTHTHTHTHWNARNNTYIPPGNLNCWQWSRHMRRRRRRRVGIVKWPLTHIIALSVRTLCRGVRQMLNLNYSRGGAGRTMLALWALCSVLAAWVAAIWHLDWQLKLWKIIERIGTQEGAH